MKRDPLFEQLQQAADAAKLETKLVDVEDQNKVQVTLADEEKRAVVLQYERTQEEIDLTPVPAAPTTQD